MNPTHAEVYRYMVLLTLFGCGAATCLWLWWRARNRAYFWRSRAELHCTERRLLWNLLDDIDTLDDACRSDDALFRRRARDAQKCRWQIYNPREPEPISDAELIESVLRGE